MLARRNCQILAGRFIGVNIDGCRFKLPGFSEDIWRSLIADEYEYPERQTIKKYLNPQQPVVELGGCLGVVSCIANRLLDRPRKHIVVEASPRFAKIIGANAARNKCDLVLVNAAIAYGCESVTFWVNPALPYSSALTPIHAGCRKITVPTTTLKVLCEQFSIETSSLICDIEGQEYEMVMNELPILSEHFSSLILETHPRIIGRDKTDQMLAALSTSGFKILEIQDDVYVFKRS
jgi:FkbM family methyltransferase